MQKNKIKMGQTLIKNSAVPVGGNGACPSQIILIIISQHGIVLLTFFGILGVNFLDVASVREWHSFNT